MKAIAAIALLLLLAATGCAELQKAMEPAAAPKPAAPQITEDMLRARAQDQLQTGAQQFQGGDFDSAMRTLTASLEHGMLSKADQSRARKLLAFTHCVQGRDVPCREEFRKAFEINPEFSLTAAEDGHPIWGPIYRDVRTQLITEREAAQQRRSGIMPLAKAEQQLANGMVKYDAGDYDAALKLYAGALKDGLKDKGDQVRALKYTAFSLCLKSMFRECRAEFLRIYTVEPAFDLTPAEAGHPSWTRTFASAKAQAKKEQQEKAQREAREKAKAPPAATVPPKK